MLSIVSNPTQAPMRSVRLTNDAGRSIVRAIVAPGQNQDIVLPTPNKQRLALLYPPLESVRLECVGLTQAQYHELELLRRLRTGVHALANYDEATQLWSPLSGTTYALMRDETAGRYMSKTAATVDSNRTRHYIDNDTLQMTSIATDALRFEAGALYGHGPLLESHYGNLITNDGVPSAGTPLWSVVSGTCTLSYRTDRQTPNPTSGALEAEIGAASACTVEIANVDLQRTIDQDYRYGCTVWLRGAGRLRAKLSWGTSSSNYGGGYVTVGYSGHRRKLPNGWCEYHFVFDKTTERTVQFADLQLELDSQPFTQYLELGPAHLYEMGGTTYVPQITSWTADNTAPPTGEHENVYWSKKLPSEPFTLSFVANAPQSGKTCRVWTLDTAGNSLFHIGDTGDARFYLGGEMISVNLVDLDSATEGNPMYVCCRYNPLSGNTGDGERGMYLYVRLYEDDPDPPLTLIDTGDYHTWEYSAQDLGPNVGDLTNTKLTLSGNIAQPSARMYPQHLRLDARAWSNAEIQDHGRMMLSGAYRQAARITQGRTFRITELEAEPLQTGTNLLRCAIDLEEIAVDSDFAVMER